MPEKDLSYRLKTCNDFNNLCDQPTATTINQFMCHQS